MDQLLVRRFWMRPFDNLYFRFYQISIDNCKAEYWFHDMNVVLLRDGLLCPFIAIRCLVCCLLDVFCKNFLQLLIQLSGKINNSIHTVHWL